MTTAHLALRYRDPTGWRGLFALLIRLRLVTHYPHAGVVVGQGLFQATLVSGVHRSSAPRAGWLLLPTTVPANVALERIERRLGRRYDWFSLLAFLLPWRVRWSQADYCFEFAFYVLTGEEPAGPVTAEHLLALVAQQLAASTPQERAA